MAIALSIATYSLVTRCGASLMYCRAITIAAWLALIAAASGCTPSAQSSQTGAIAATEAALLDQISCRKDPQVAKALNAMLANGLIKYGANESGVYVFTPTKPLTLLGLKVTSISGFDYTAFKGAPGSVMAGAAPPVFLEVDVEASAADLRKRALDAGLVERGTARGFEIVPGGSYLAPKSSATISGIQCAREVR